MARKKLRTVFLLLIGLVFLPLLLARAAQAVPSFARQTRMPCTECHTIFPELTPFGRIFKLGGYVLSKSGKPYELPPPLAGMAQVSFTESRGLTSGVAPFDSANRGTDRINLPQQLSLFFGGRIYDKIGAFVQGTYDGVSNKVFLDILDIRYSNNTVVWGKNTSPTRSKNVVLSFFRAIFHLIVNACSARLS